MYVTLTGRAAKLEGLRASRQCRHNKSTRLLARPARTCIGQGPCATQKVSLTLAISQKPFLALAAVTALAAEKLENPTMGVLLVHVVLSLPRLGLGGGVWLQWIMSNLLDLEPTLVGRLLTKVISGVAFATIVNFLVPLVQPSALQLHAFCCSQRACDTKPARSSTAVLSKLVTVFSVCIVAIAFAAPPYPPSNIAILYQRITPCGLLLVAETTATNPPVRYLRQDASIVGVSEVLNPDPNTPKALVEPESPAYVLSTTETMNNIVRLAHTSAGKNALVLGFKSGLLTRSLVGHGYNCS